MPWLHFGGFFSKSPSKHSNLFQEAFFPFFLDGKFLLHLHQQCFLLCQGGLVFFISFSSFILAQRFVLLWFNLISNFFLDFFHNIFGYGCILLFRFMTNWILIDLQSNWKIMSRGHAYINYQKNVISKQ
jgi:hypothetical protein